MTRTYKDNVMASSKQPLAQSESKQRFMDRLGLDENNMYHRRLYAMMKEEAVEGRRRMTENQAALLPELRGNTSLEPPYSHAHVSETAVHREILIIYHLARPETRRIYDLGHDNERVEQENWIIRWMLWHVFRYRDNRNKGRRGVGEDCLDSMKAMSARNAVAKAKVATVHGYTSRYWDPVRQC